MKNFNVKLCTEQDILSFVAKTIQIPYDIDLICGHYVIDAKSILGVMSIGQGKDITLRAHSDDTATLETAIQEFIVS